MAIKISKIKKIKTKNQIFFEKKIFNIKKKYKDNIIVPGGTTIRKGTFIEKNVVVMPPSFINIGAIIKKNTMIDSNVLIGSFAKIGKNNHISAGVQIGGCLEPINSFPVITEKNVFIGGNCGIFDGVIIKKNCVIGAGTTITSSMKIYDINNKKKIIKKKNYLTVPKNSIVVQGSKKIKNTNLNTNVLIIIKKNNKKTKKKLKINNFLR